MGDQVTADLSALTTFAKTVGKLADTSAKQCYTLGTEATAMATLLTTGMFSEVANFGSMYATVAQSAQAALADMAQNPPAMSGGVEATAINYAGTDQFGADLLNKIKEGKGFEALAVALHGKADISTKAVDNAFNPKDDKSSIWGGDAGTAKEGEKKTAQAPADTFQQEVDAENKARNFGYGTGSDTSSLGYKAEHGLPFTIGTGDTKIDVPGDPKLPGDGSYLDQQPVKPN
jgi:hypothetical protein